MAFGGVQTRSGLAAFAMRAEAYHVVHRPADRRAHSCRLGLGAHQRDHWDCEYATASSSTVGNASAHTASFNTPRCDRSCS